MSRLPPDDSSKKPLFRPVRAALNSGALFSEALSFGINDCPACGQALGTSQTRTEIAKQIIEAARLTGSFEVKSTQSFWRMFSDKLCASCRLALDSGPQVLANAAALLEEALRLDPSNEPAKKNLEAVKSMRSGL